jgi:hypothetical protein
VSRRGSDLASPTTVSSKGTPERLLLVNVLVQMSKVLLNSQQGPETEVVTADEALPDSDDSKSTTNTDKKRLT